MLSRLNTLIRRSKPLRSYCALFGCAVFSHAVQAHAALEIMVEDAAAPWSQADGSGAANDIVKAAFATAGVDVTLTTVAYARCKHMVLTGQVAGCFSMATDASIADKVILSDAPLYRNYSQYLQNSQHPLPARNGAEIRSGTVIGIVAGYEYPPSVTALETRGVTLEVAGSETANLKKLAAGRIAATVVQLDELKSIAFLTGVAGVEKSVTPLFRAPEQGSYIGFSKLHPQGQWARERFNAGFAKIRSDGTLQKIIAKWKAQQRS